MRPTERVWHLRVSEREKLKTLAVLLAMHERQQFRVGRHPEQTPGLVRACMRSHNPQIEQQLRWFLHTASADLLDALQEEGVLTSSAALRFRESYASTTANRATNASSIGRTSGRPGSNENSPIARAKARISGGLSREHRHQV